MLDYEEAAQRLAERAAAAFDETAPEDWRWLETFFDAGQPDSNDLRVSREKVRRRESIVNDWAKAMGWRYSGGSYEIEKLTGPNVRIESEAWSRAIDHPETFRVNRRMVGLISHSYEPSAPRLVRPAMAEPEPWEKPRREETGPIPATVIRLPRSWYFPHGDGNDSTTAYLFARLDVP